MWGSITNNDNNKKHTSGRHINFKVENLLNVRSKNHGHKSVNQTPLWSKLWLQESHKSQHKLCSITSQIAIQQRWNRKQEAWKNHKIAATKHGL